MGTTRTRRTPVPPVEPADDVAPLVEDDAPAQAQAPLVVAIDPASVTAAVAAVIKTDEADEAELELPTRFVVAHHAELDAHAVLARTSLEDWDGWEYVEDLPDGEPPLLPARFAPSAD